MAKQHNHRKVSDVLEEFIRKHKKGTVTVSEFRDAISTRSFGLLMFVFALPCVIPIPTPGLSTIVGLPLTVITFQLMLGMRSPWLPKIISERKFKQEEMKRSFNYMLPYLKKLEKVMRPRLDFLVMSHAERVIAVICFALSLMILLPIPFGNAIPAFAICFFSLAILTHDGLFAIFGLMIAAIAFLVANTFYDVIAATLQSIFG